MAGYQNVAVTKVLSANDLGETGGHQAGILIPKDPLMLSFFPPLDSSKKNPRCHLLFEDPSRDVWEFAFIYYNNKHFGGTRNEYRLTRMTRYLRQSGAKVGVTLRMEHLFGERYSVSIEVPNERVSDGRTVLELGKGWKIIDV